MSLFRAEARSDLYAQIEEALSSEEACPVEEAVRAGAAPADKHDMLPHPIDMLQAGQSYDEAALRADYIARGLHLVPDTFALYRILGNDLVPRHAAGQTRRNLQFALEHEPDLPGCRKFWVVNRIYDPVEKARIIALLETYGQDYVDIPFSVADFQAVEWDFDHLPVRNYLHSLPFFRYKGPASRERVASTVYRLKNLYMMNNNGARNVALAAGKRIAKWVLPWDGNCFVTAEAWNELRNAVLDRPYLSYFAVPMQRMLDNDALISGDFTLDPAEEPQVIFRSDSTEVFNEAYAYGRRSKVEFFWRLKISGRWNSWKTEAWDVARPPASPEAGQYGVAGWVARMFSGMAALEQGDHASHLQRGLARHRAILDALDAVGGRVFQKHNGEAMGVYAPAALAAAKQALMDAPQSPAGQLARRLVADAEASLTQGPWSVMDKTTCAPSGDRRDYWHPAPYWWPNPDTADGLPYIKRDGVRVPGTVLHTPASNRYDRSHLQLMFDHTTRLALGWSLTGRNDLADHGAALVRAWFIDESTRMTPHLTYAQVRCGHNKNRGYPAGLIEFRDLYCLLDAVRLLERAGALTPEDCQGLTAWFGDYLVWLEDSDQAQKECCSDNNHGVYYDLQIAAIYAWLGREAGFRATLLRAQSRVLMQIDETGWQAEEMVRPLSQHYVAFNLQGLFNLFRLARGMGYGAGLFSPAVRARLRTALDWFLSHDMKAWPYKQFKAFDAERVWPLVCAAIELGIVEAADLPEAWRPGDVARLKAVFANDDSIPLYWNLGR